MIFVEGNANNLQLFAPIVFGIISENTKIRIVNIADTIPKDSSPNSLVAAAPTPAAPIVCAMVFSDRIAATGPSISVLYFLRSDKSFHENP